MQAATFTVVNTNNAGNGSLRKAIQDANGSAGADTIVFNIPGAGVRTITLNSALPTITETLDINGMTQPGSSVNTDTLGTNALLRIEINGNSMAVRGFHIDAPNCMIRGLIMNRFLTNSIVLSPSSSGTVIVGNFIGTNSQGDASLGTRNGLFVQSSGNSIGGSNLSQRNLFAGCTNNAAVRLSGASANNNLVRGNLFGLQRDGVTQIGTLWNGIRIELGSSDNQIGQPGIGANMITSSSSHGLVITDATSTGNVISGNIIYDNGGLAIDLNNDGVTLNDLGDSDPGANGLLNFPILNDARILGSDLILRGNATAGSTIELFTSDNDASGFGEGRTFLVSLVEGSVADADATSGTYGPGSINGSLQGADNTERFTFTVPLPVGVVDGTTLTATLTLANNTSEFSGVVRVRSDLDLDDDGIPNTLEIGDTDSDGVPNELDLDSDNDGIYDCVESGVNAAHVNGVLSGAINLNGIPASADTDGDDTIDYVLRDSDSDSNYDFTELDSDNDGCNDVLEAGYTDVNDDGELGPTPLTVDSAGLVTSAGP